jgi:hypothetical protein
MVVEMKDIYFYLCADPLPICLSMNFCSTMPLASESPTLCLYIYVVSVERESVYPSTDALPLGTQRLISSHNPGVHLSFLESNSTHVLIRFFPVVFVHRRYSCTVVRDTLLGDMMLRS